MQTAVEQAIEIVGGVTKASNACGVSNSAVYQWLELGYVPRAKHAVLLAEATAHAGRPVPIRAIAGLEQWSWSPVPGPKGKGRTSRCQPAELAA